MASSATSTNSFLASNAEKLKLNQYWYSSATINTMIQEIEAYSNKSTAFLSTPSLYFSLKSPQLKTSSYLFDFDENFAKTAPNNFVHYNFYEASKIPKEFHHSFDYVVIDPPFITEEVWKLYADAAKLLLIEGNESISVTTEDNLIKEITVPKGKLLLSTIPENFAYLKQIMDVDLCKFRPSIPNLIYQYSLYTNYSSQLLSQWNPEIDQDEIDKMNKNLNRLPSSRKKTTMESYSSDQCAIDQAKADAGTDNNLIIDNHVGSLQAQAVKS
jgi:16S rRNA G966 N2-methylase RsmD